MSAMLRSGDSDFQDSDDISEAIQVQPGDTLQLHCPVSGSPIPTVHWLKLQYGNTNTNEQEYREELVNNTSPDTTTLVRYTFSRQN